MEFANDVTRLKTRVMSQTRGMLDPRSTYMQNCARIHARACIPSTRALEASNHAAAGGLVWGCAPAKSPHQLRAAHPHSPQGI